MPRPSMAAKRTGQIIDATLRTIAARGITGTTLDRVAEEAGMSRGHVRHFVGNRDQLLEAAARAFYSEGEGRPSILPDAVSSLHDAVDYLFGDTFTVANDENAVVLGLVEAGRANPAILEILESAYAGTEHELVALIGARHPTAEADAVAKVAGGILALAIGNVFLADISVSPSRTASARAAAELLLAALPE